MKQIILLILAVFLTTVGSSQENPQNSSNWNQSILDKRENNPEIKMYPNPCKTEKITIDFNSNKIAEILVTNITGKQILKKKFDFAENKKQLELGDIMNGIYLVKVTSEKKVSVVKKLVVNKQ